MKKLVRGSQTWLSRWFLCLPLGISLVTHVLGQPEELTLRLARRPKCVGKRSEEMAGPYFVSTGSYLGLHPPQMYRSTGELTGSPCPAPHKRTVYSGGGGVVRCRGELAFMPSFSVLGFSNRDVLSSDQGRAKSSSFKVCFGSHPAGFTAFS